jgi:hypothetical protein
MHINPITKRPYFHNDLFRGDPDRWHLNACVGHNGGPYDYRTYGDGYLRAAIAIIPSIESRNNPVDVMIYPIAYCFRHAIELYLKHFSETLPRLWGEVGMAKPTHKLLDNWSAVKSYLVRDSEFQRGNGSVEQFEKILKDLVQIDPSGEIFRFPVSRQGMLHLEDTSVINVLILRSAMLEAHDILETWARTADAMYEYKVDYGEL